MRLIVCGSRTYGIKYNDENKWVKDLPRTIEDKDAIMLLVSTLDGIWQEATMGYMTVDMYGFTLIEGTAPGADTLAKWWAESSPMHSYDPFPEDRSNKSLYPDHPPFEHLSFKPQWSTAGKAAGPMRNQEMLGALLAGDPSESRLVIAFVDKPLEDSKGTFDMVTRARHADVTVYVSRIYR